MLLDVTVARSVSIVGSGGVKVSGAACCELIHSFESFRVPGRSYSGGGGELWGWRTAERAWRELGNY